jgi:lipopolysaccharide/colanic/teichoic acid biosynthesis glycosyltransferase
MKDFEWLTKSGFEYTKKEYTIEEKEKMGIPLEVQREAARVVHNAETEICKTALMIGMITIGLCIFNPKFLFVAMLILIYIIIELFHAYNAGEHMNKISKIMYLRSLHR